MLAIFEEHIGEAPAEFYLGGYGNFDAFAYHCCRKYQKTHPVVSLLYITPYIAEIFQRTHLIHQKDEYDGIVYPDIESRPLKFAILYRNKWMIERADLVICAIEHTWGGAYQSLLHARRKKKPIYHIID